MPRKERCPGSGDPVGGADEPDGTVQCFKCGRSFLRMRTVIKDGVKKFFVPDHDRTPPKLPRKKGSRTGNGRRRSGRS